MGSMNTNNWLSFPDLSTSHHASLPSQLQASQSHQFSLGLVNDSMDNINPFQNQEWNLIDSEGSNEVPKVADFLGVSKSSVDDQQSSDAVAYSDSDYLFQNNGLAQVVHQSSVISASSGGGCAGYDYQENPNNLQALTLSMGSGKGSDSTSAADSSSNTSIVEATPRRTLDTFGQRTSIYRGVTRHRWTGRYEAHLWDNSCRREGQSRKGRQVYLGGYDKEEKAARAYDLAALKYWGTSTTTNFPISNYEKEVEEMKHMTRQEFVASIRRKSSGFSRGASMYRGVTRHHQHGRWQARIGRVAGNKDLYLGTFSTEEEAAEAYDIAAIKFRGLNAVTNFDMNRYDVKSILESNTLPIGGGAAKRLKEAQALESSRKREEMIALSSSFQYGSSSTASASAGNSSGGTTRLQGYPVMFDLQHHHHTLLSLQNHDAINTSHHHYQDPTTTFHQSYIQTQLQLQQQSGTTSYTNANTNNNSSQFSFSGGYGSSVQNHPAFLQGLMDSSNNNNSSHHHHHAIDGYNSSNLGMSVTANSTGSNSADHELALVKVDYDVPTNGTGYGGWPVSGSGHGSSTGVFPMWND